MIIKNIKEVERIEKPRKVCAGEIQEIPGIGLHILVTIVFGKDLAR